MYIAQNGGKRPHYEGGGEINIYAALQYTSHIHMSLFHSGM